MKKPLFLITAVLSLALGAAATAQEATPTPTPESQPGSSPAPAAPAAGQPAEATPTPTPTPEETPAPAAATEPDATVPDEELIAEQPSEPEPDADLLPPPADDLLPGDATAGEDLPDPDSLIPDDITGSEALPPPPPNVVENKFQQERKLTIRYQEVKLQALKDEKVRSLREQADKATTDEGKRQALREYYRLLFGKMVAIDAALEDKCDAMEKAYLRRLGQYRVEPTIPLNPPPTPEPLDLADLAPASARGN